MKQKQKVYLFLQGQTYLPPHNSAVLGQMNLLLNALFLSLQESYYFINFVNNDIEIINEIEEIKLLKSSAGFSSFCGLNLLFGIIYLAKVKGIPA